MEIIQVPIISEANTTDLIYYKIWYLIIQVKYLVTDYAETLKTDTISMLLNT